MADVQIKLVGLDRLVRLLAVGGERAVPALGRALHDEAVGIFARSQDQVPVDTGVLKSSGQVHPPSISAGDVIVEITYGGNARAYAERQHEEVSYRHDPGQKAKFLEDPFMDSRNGFENRLTDRVEAVLRGLV